MSVTFYIYLFVTSVPYICLCVYTHTHTHTHMFLHEEQNNIMGNNMMTRVGKMKESQNNLNKYSFVNYYIYSAQWESEIHLSCNEWVGIVVNAIN